MDQEFQFGVFAGDLFIQADHGRHFSPKCLADSPNQNINYTLWTRKHCRAILAAMPRPKKNGLRQIVAANVRHFRLLSKMTQEELAHKVGISVPYMSQIENGVANCSLDIVEAISTALGISAVSLVVRRN